MNESRTHQQHRRNPPRAASTRHKAVVSILLTLLFGAGISAIAWAFDDGPHRGPGRHGYGPWGAEGGPMMSRFIVRALDWQVDLDDTQKAAIEQIVDEAAEEGRVLRQEMGSLRKEIADTIEANGYVEEQVRAMVETHSTQMVDLMMLRIRTMAQIHAQLTPEQQAKVKEFRDKRRGSRSHRHGPASPADNP